MAKQAAILCIGTEVTSGEIVNTNGAWLGEKLEELGFEITSHVVVPDDKDLILDALDWQKLQADLVIVSGGLGPTTDDITREVMAEWAGVELAFSESEWLKMNLTYRDRGLPIREAHRRQCHFPSGSRLIPNSVGTALGFSLDVKDLRVVVLPGPPRELHAMWSESALAMILELSPETETELLIWTCLGVPESEAAEVAEEAIKGSGLKIGYRATVPYVKVKLWVPNATTERKVWTDRLDQALQPWVVARGQDDLLLQFLKATAATESILIRDSVTLGRLASRISALGERHVVWPENLQVETGVSKVGTPAPARPGQLVLSLSEGNGPSLFQCAIQFNGREEISELQLPYKIQTKSSRGASYAAEMALRWWVESLPGIGS